MSNNDKRIHSFNDLKTQMKDKNYHNYPNNFGEEGEDHINISIFSKTNLGKIMSPEYNKIVSYPHIGNFNSVLSLWFWIRNSDLNDNLRRLTGVKLKTYVKTNKLYGSFTPNFKSIIGYATWIKIKSYDHILQNIRDLPDNVKIISYYSIKSSGLRLCTNYSTVLIDVCNEIIKAVKEGREPDFLRFADNKEKCSLMYLESVLSNICTPEKIEDMKRIANKSKNTGTETDEDTESEVVHTVSESEEVNTTVEVVTPNDEDEEEIPVDTTLLIDIIIDDENTGLKDTT